MAENYRSIRTGTGTTSAASGELTWPVGRDLRDHDTTPAILTIAGGPLSIRFHLVAERSIGATGMRPMVTAHEVFVPIVLGATLRNMSMWTDAAQAGYAVGEQVAIFVAIFPVSAVGTLCIWRRC